MTTRGTVAVLGGGIAGLATALALGRRGWSVRVFEREVARQRAGFGFVLPESAVDSLEVLAPGMTLGLVGRPIDTFELRDLGGTVVHVAGLPGALGLTRKDLVDALEAQVGDGVVEHGKVASGFTRDATGRATSVSFTDGSEFAADLFVVAEGIHSPQRAALFPGARLTPSQVTEIVMRLRDPELVAEVGTRFLKFQAPEGGLALGVVACSAVDLVWYVQMSAERFGEAPRSAAARAAFLREHFAACGPVVTRLIEASDLDDAHVWRTTDMDPLPALHAHNLVLVGDAAHPVLPFTSQGVGAAVNDVAALASSLESYGGDIPLALATYSAARLPFIEEVVAGGRALRERFLEPGRFKDGPVVPVVK